MNILSIIGLIIKNWKYILFGAAFFVAGVYLAWQIQGIRINNIKADMKICKSELKQTQDSAETCLKSLQKTTQAIEKIKIEYNIRLKDYIKKTEKIRLKEQYEQIKPQEGLDTCANLKAMLDRLAQIEEGGK